MTITITFPSGQDALEYLASFSAAFSDNLNMQSALLGAVDSLRQGALFIGEPLGLLACLTAEEEAAAFLYYGLQTKGYSVPQYGKIHGHRDKVKLLVFALAMHEYFFSHIPAEFESSIKIERDGQNPRTSHVFNHSGYSIVQEDFLETIVTAGDGEEAHDSAISTAVDKVLTDMTPSGFTPASHITKLANRRNLCLYGNPDQKLRVHSMEEINRYKGNCILMIVLGFLVLNSHATTTSMNKLVDDIFEKIQK